MKRARFMAAGTAAVLLTVLSSVGTAHAVTVTGYYEITNADGNLCLDASTDPGNPHVPGDKVQLWTCDNSPNQAWGLAPNGELVNDDGGLCLDASTSPGNPNTPGDTVQLWTCDGGPNQLWPTGGGANGYTEIFNNAGGLVLDASTDPGSPHVPGDAVQLWSNDNSPNQNWYFSLFV